MSEVYMKNKDSGFTLIEMLIVIAIIGILAAIALPALKGHMVKAKLSEVFNAMSTVASAVSAYHQDTDGFWPNCPTAVEIRNSLGVGLTSITRISDMSVTNVGVITATVQNIDPMVDTRAVILTPTEDIDKSIKWTWGASPGFPEYLRPRSN